MMANKSDSPIELVQDSTGDVIFFSPQRRSGTSSIVNILCGRSVKGNYISQTECPKNSVVKHPYHGSFNTIRLTDASGNVCIFVQFVLCFVYIQSGF